MNFVRRHRILAGVVAVLVIIALVYSFFGRSEEKPKLALSEVLTRAKQGHVVEIDVFGDRLTVKMADGSEYRSRKEHETNIIDVLQDNGVEVGGENGVVVDVHSSRDAGEAWIYFIIAFLPTIAFVVLIFAAAYWVFRRARSQNT